MNKLIITLGTLPVLMAACALPAHTTWSRPNAADPSAYGIYQFTDAAAPLTSGSSLAAAATMPASRSLVVQSTSAGSFGTNTFTLPVLAPRALTLQGTVTARAAEVFPDTSGDLTMEAWLRWEASLSSATVMFGMNSLANLRIVRDEANPANDRFGLQFTHGDYASAPGFTSWANIGPEEAPLGDWVHVAATIKSSGHYYNAALGHDCYTTGTVARFFLNGHYFGTSPFTVDIAHNRIHPDTFISIRSQGGSGVALDEVSLWARDWSSNGTVANPFSNGRGSGSYSAAVADWQCYEGCQ